MKTGTASRAAETLGITQPAVSRSLAQLESAVGFSLFARVRNRLVPTPEAKQLYRDVESTFRGIDSLRASAARIRDRGSGEIRVATLAALSSSLVPRAVRHFQKKHQTVRVTLHVLLSRHVRDVVASGQFDLGLAEGVGIGMVHPYVTVTDARIVLRPFEPAIEIRSYLIMPTDRPKSRLVRDFIDALMA